MSLAAVLLYTAPSIVLIFSAILFKEKITNQKVFVIIVTFIGCGLASGIIGGIGKMNVMGLLYGLGAGFGYAMYSIFSRYALERGYSDLTITFYTFLVAAVVSVPMSNTEMIVAGCTSGVGMIIFCLVFGLVSTVMPYMLYTRGLENMENSRASVIASIEPITATVIGRVVYHEVLDGFQMAGIVLVLGSVLIQNISIKET